MTLLDAKPSKPSLTGQITFQRLFIGCGIVCPCSGIAACILSVVLESIPGEKGWKGAMIAFLFLAAGFSGMLLGVLVLVAIVRRIKATP